MNTQTHMLIAATLFAKPGGQNRTRNIAALAGGLVPDLTIFIMFFWSKLTSTPQAVVWEKWYYSPFWQFWIDSFNSLPLFLIALLCGIALLLFSKKQPAAAIALIVFSLAALAHIAGDFFLHVEDAHAHFWPINDWRFVSSISYWNPKYYGNYALIAEMVLGIIMVIALYRRFNVRWIRTLLLITIISYIAVPAYFIFSLGL